MEYGVTPCLIVNTTNQADIVNIFVDSIQPVTWDKIAYDRLVLPPETKDLVKALVTVRTSQRGVKTGIVLGWEERGHHRR